MECPVCRTDTLAPRELEPGLDALACATCGGNWITTAHYWQWRDRHGDNLPKISAASSATADTSLFADDILRPKRCPDDGAPLLPYRVGHDLPFRIDRCAHCHGVWFDADEWETLKARNLHDDVHRIFTTPWQNAVAQEEHHRNRHALLVTRFGEDDFARLREVKAWLDRHPERHAMLAYLADGED